MEDDTAYIPLFAQEQRRQGRSPGTIRVREGQLERVLKAFGSFDAVTPRHLEKWLKDQELNTRTQRNYISNLSAFYRWGVQCNFFDEDPTEGITRPDIQPKHQEIRDKDVAKVLSAASRPEIRAWLVLMAYQGLRCQDIAELRRESVDLEASPPLLKLGDEKTNWGGSTVLHHEVVSSIRALTNCPRLAISDGDLRQHLKKNRPAFRGERSHRQFELTALVVSGECPEPWTEFRS